MIRQRRQLDDRRVDAVRERVFGQPAVVDGEDQLVGTSARLPGSEPVIRLAVGAEQHRGAEHQPAAEQLPVLDHERSEVANVAYRKAVVL